MGIYTALKSDTEYRFGFHNDESYIYKSPKGLTSDTISRISRMKQEPLWMRKFRLQSYTLFTHKKMPTWGVNLTAIDFNTLCYYIKPIRKRADAWRDLPFEIRQTYEKIGIPLAEKKFLSGVSAQYESEVVYKSIKKTLEAKGVIFLDMDSALKVYPDLVRTYFATVVPSADNKFAALNSSVWSGGSFIYVPPNVHVELPLQAYFRINAAAMGQFERTLIIADTGSSVQYIEGCSAPVYSTDSLHSAVVEIIVKKGARVRYTTVQNWSKNVYNLVTKRARVAEEGVMEWIDGNIGSKFTMKYPSVYLAGRKARGEILTIAYAGSGQHQDAGAKAVHLAPETTSHIVSKSVSRSGGRSTFRGLVQMVHGATNSHTRVTCNALMLDDQSRTDTYPTMNINETNVQVEHEASVSKIRDDQLYYLQSRGISKGKAQSLIVNGFIEPIIREIPLEYAVELNRLITLEMDEGIG